jgi:hypothetical protein
VFLKREKDHQKWKIEYDETVYKIYDRNNDLAGYFFPDYGLVFDQKSSEDQKEEEVLVPLVKLDLLDIEDEHIELDVAYKRMEADLQRMDAWKTWMKSNSDRFGIIGNGIYTSREDRNMLSIALQLNSQFILHEKEIGQKLKPILDSLNESGLL